MSKAELKTGIYRHYKGKLYEVLGLSRHSETLEAMVIYRALYDSKDFGLNALWVRPLDLFLETVTVDGEVKDRFEFVSQASTPSTCHH